MPIVAYGKLSSRHISLTPSRTTRPVQGAVYERFASARIRAPAVYPHVHLWRSRRHGIRASKRRRGPQGARDRVLYRRGRPWLRLCHRARPGRPQPRPMRPDWRGAPAQRDARDAFARPVRRRYLRRHRQDAKAHRRVRHARDPRRPRRARRGVRPQAHPGHGARHRHRDHRPRTRARLHHQRGLGDHGAHQRRRPARRRGTLLRPARYLPRRRCAAVEYPSHHLGRHRRQNALPREQGAAKAAAQAHEEIPVHGAQRRL